MGDEGHAPPQRLGDFILENMEAILGAWEDFARSFWPTPDPDTEAVRNDAELMLRAVVTDMRTAQTPAEQKIKSEGAADGDASGMNQAALGHALARVSSGFDIKMMVAEFRALRASVNRLWWESVPTPHPEQIADMGRFNEALDQLVSASVCAFTERVDRSRHLFLGMLGHDLRQPVQSLRMLTDLLAHPAPLPAGPKPILAQMHTCFDAIAGMMDDLLDFTSTQLGEAMPIRLAPANLGTICASLVEELRAAYPRRLILLEASGNMDGHWDAARLRQLCSNLISNAIHHGAAERPVTLTLRPSGNEFQLAVHNWGVPIPMDAMGILFDPMVRLAPGVGPKQRGSMGLGLYICRQIVLAHGGEIHVESSLEEGTTFSVLLPKDCYVAAAGRAKRRNPHIQRTAVLSR